MSVKTEYQERLYLPSLSCRQESARVEVVVTLVLTRFGRVVQL